MENFRNERCIAEAGDFLNGVDHEANEKLNKEIADLRSEGCKVKVGERPILHIIIRIKFRTYTIIWNEAERN